MASASTCLVVAPGCRYAHSETLKTEGLKSRTAKTYVLVHGAWHGGWCWRYVADRLRTDGHHVFTPTLTGLGERSHLNTRDVNLTTHVQDILNVLNFEDLRDVVLVGHSYAGLVVSLVADKAPERIKSLVYLDAVLPKVGEPFFPAEQHDVFKTKYAEDFSLPPGDMAFLGIPEEHKYFDWVKSKLTPHPLGSFLEPVIYENNGPAGLSKTFIRCTENPRYSKGDPVKEMTQSDPEWTYTTIETGHDAMVTAPIKLAEILTEI